jgi:Zn-dependent peptidase ImmA (M78 family)
MKIWSNNPFAAAIELRQSIGWINPSDFSLEEVAGSLGISIKEVQFMGSQGRILMNRDSGIISLNSKINNQKRNNFTIAHEIGHFILHKNLAFFSDTHKTLSEWHRKGPQETQANEFASELLMPSDSFSSKVHGKKLNIALMEEVSSYFNVSRLAAFLKYIPLGSYPVMIIFMESSMVKWKRFSDDFPFQFLPLNSPVPAYTVAGDYFHHGNLELEPEKIDAIEWFPEDYRIRYKKDWKLWEQCYKVSENGLVSCLWTY